MANLEFRSSRTQQHSATFAFYSADQARPPNSLIGSWSGFHEMMARNLAGGVAKPTSDIGFRIEYVVEETYGLVDIFLRKLPVVDAVPARLTSPLDTVTVVTSVKGASSPRD